MQSSYHDISYKKSLQDKHRISRHCCLSVRHDNPLFSGFQRPPHIFFRNCLTVYHKTLQVQLFRPLSGMKYQDDFGAFPCFAQGAKAVP